MPPDSLAANKQIVERFVAMLNERRLQWLLALDSSTPRLAVLPSCRLMDPLIAALALVLLTATMGTLFSVAKKRGEGLPQALIGIAVGWLLFLSPLYFFGPVGAIVGVIVIVLIGALMSYIGQRYGRGPAATSRGPGDG